MGDAPENWHSELLTDIDSQSIFIQTLFLNVFPYLPFQMLVTLNSVFYGKEISKIKYNLHIFLIPLFT